MKTLGLKTFSRTLYPTPSIIILIKALNACFLRLPTQSLTDWVANGKFYVMLYTLGGIKQEKFILSQFWRPEVQNQGVCRAGSFSCSEEASVSCLYPRMFPVIYLGTPGDSQ